MRASATPTPSPALTPFTWSSDLQAVAQAYANQCNYAHNPNRGNDVGENIAASAPPGSWTVTDAVNAWASEGASYTYSTGACSVPECGHYTQIVWRGTTSVGCGHQTCTFNSPFQGFSSWDFWVCDYSPAGNVVGQKPY